VSTNPKKFPPLLRANLGGKIPPSGYSACHTLRDSLDSSNERFPKSRTQETQGVLRNHLLRDVRSGLLVVTQALPLLFGALPKKAFAIVTRRKSKESETWKMDVQRSACKGCKTLERKLTEAIEKVRDQALQAAEHEEAMKKVEVRLFELASENTRQRQALEILDKAMLGIVECEDIILVQGTQEVMRRVMELVKMAWLDSECARVPPSADDDRPTQPFCTKCQTYLSVNSQIAGYCIKCTHEAPRK